MWENQIMYLFIYLCFCWKATDIVILTGSHNSRPFWCASMEGKFMGQWVKKGVTRQICLCEWNIDRKYISKVLTTETLLKTKQTNASVSLVHCLGTRFLHLMSTQICHTKHNILFLYQFSHQSQVEKYEAYSACRAKELKEQHRV